MPDAADSTAKQIVQAIESDVRRIAEEVVFGATRNQRPGGADSWDFNASTASATVPAGGAYVPYPAVIDRLELGGLPSGTVTWQVKVARPGQALTAATLRLSGTMTASTRATISAAGLGSALTAIEAGSHVMVYCTAISGCSIAWCAVIVRCL